LGRPRISPKDRLERNASRIDNGCLVWTGALDQDGYGKLTIPRDGEDWTNGLMTVRPHRLAWELAHGPIAAGVTLDHLCRNRACIELTHLEPVSNKENIMRGEGQPAINARKTHCASGHLLGGDNLYLSPEGYRYCRTCRRRASREYHRRRRGLL